MGTKKCPGRVSKKDVLKARLALVAWVTVYLIKTNQKSKIIQIFKNRGIFSSHAKKIEAWHKDKRDTTYKKRIHQEVLDEVERYLRESRK